MEDSGEIEAELGETKVFENDDYDVLVVEVKSDGLNKINKTLSDNLEYTNSYDGYKPHLTIAYLKKAQAKSMQEIRSLPDRNLISGNYYFQINLEISSR